MQKFWLLIFQYKDLHNSCGSLRYTQQLNQHTKHASFVLTEWGLVCQSLSVTFQHKGPSVALGKPEGPAANVSRDLSWVFLDTFCFAHDCFANPQIYLAEFSRHRNFANLSLEPKNSLENSASFNWRL